MFLFGILSDWFCWNLAKIKGDSLLMMFSTKIIWLLIFDGQIWGFISVVYIVLLRYFHWCLVVNNIWSKIFQRIMLWRVSLCIEIDCQTFWCFICLFYQFLVVHFFCLKIFWVLSVFIVIWLFSGTYQLIHFMGFETLSWWHCDASSSTFGFISIAWYL